MVVILNNKMASTDRDYSPFYKSVFSVMAEDRPVGIGSLYLFISSVFANNNFDGNLICVDSTNRTFIFTCFLCTK